MEQASTEAGAGPAREGKGLARKPSGAASWLFSVTVAVTGTPGARTGGSALGSSVFHYWRTVLNPKPGQGEYKFLAPPSLSLVLASSMKPSQPNPPRTLSRFNKYPQPFAESRRRWFHDVTVRSPHLLSPTTCVCSHLSA